ncbi:amino acid permease [Bernardetia sp. ABR2-2B]|uniref:amino acid permease n=1 Tax=Bernardetia sp. ABR2-2B TaxID=3127472 RepID=UPI0030CCA253
MSKKTPISLSASGQDSQQLVKGQGFGTAPVFFTAISTILGAVMFLRFGYAVGNVGLLGSIGIIILGHIVTIPTAMAIAEIATNQKVEGGGEYYIVSRSFGLNIGATIGIALYLSQAISVAFYIIAFAQAFQPVLEYLRKVPYIIDNNLLFFVQDRLISIPALLLLILMVSTKGADLGVKALYFVVALLFISLIMFFAGETSYDFDADIVGWNHSINGDSFFKVFAICFPAFTGMTAGVGLSGDLKSPRKSIPLGTLSATFAGMIVYFFIVYKLYISASPQDLNNDQLIMQQIALWGPIILVGLAAATASSALGSILVAPRTLQALANDDAFPSQKMNNWLAKGKGKKAEPFNATIITSIIALVFVIAGDVNAVAEIISMFFMVTYGTICSISFLEHLSGDTSYRPTFRSKWYISLLGALACIFMMFSMNALIAMISLISMVVLHLFMSYYRKKSTGIVYLFQGAIFQINRELRVFLQKREDEKNKQWNPAIVCLSQDFFRRQSGFNMLRWLSHRYGFGTYIHYIQGFLSKETNGIAKETKKEIIQMASKTKSNVYIDTLVSPSLTSSIAQVLQLPGVSGLENNMFLLEFSKNNLENLKGIIDNYPLIKATSFDVCVLATSERNFGFKKSINIWITRHSFQNANLMILLAYVIVGHRDWKDADIKLMAVYQDADIETERERLIELIKSGRLPISATNVELIAQRGKSMKEIINEKSKSADLTMIGLNDKQVKEEGENVFKGYDTISDILFVNSHNQKIIQ